MLPNVSIPIELRYMKLHTYKNTEGDVDGGLLNNFPVNSLFPTEEGGTRVGITFRREAGISSSSALEYVLSLISCVIDDNVERSSFTLGVNEAIVLDTDLDTFSFAQAYEYINSRAYDDTRQFVREKVKSIIVAARAARLSDSVLHKSDAEKLAELQEKYIRDVGGLFGRVQRAHAFVSRAAPKRLEKKVVEYRCYNLAGDTTRKDSCTVTDFILTEAPLYAYGLTVMADDLALNIGDPDFSVRDSENQNHEAVAVALPDSYRGQISIEYANLMLFLQEPLLPSETPHQYFSNGGWD